MPISHNASWHEVSREFVYDMQNLALKGIAETFYEILQRSDGNTLFNLPVTKSWLRQLVTALTLCHNSSFKGIQEWLEGVSDYKISIGAFMILFKKGQDKRKLLMADVTC